MVVMELLQNIGAVFLGWNDSRAKLISASMSSRCARESERDQMLRILSFAKLIGEVRYFEGGSLGEFVDAAPDWTFIKVTGPPFCSGVIIVVLNLNRPVALECSNRDELHPRTKWWSCHFDKRPVWRCIDELSQTSTLKITHLTNQFCEAENAQHLVSL
jgi:hypothetical protein